MIIEIRTLTAHAMTRPERDGFSHWVTLKFGDAEVMSWPVPDGLDWLFEPLGDRERRDKYVDEFAAKKLAKLFMLADQVTTTDETGQLI